MLCVLLYLFPVFDNISLFAYFWFHILSKRFLLIFLYLSFTICLPLSLSVSLLFLLSLSLFKYYTMSFPSRVHNHLQPPTPPPRHQTEPRQNEKGPLNEFFLDPLQYQKYLILNFRILKSPLLFSNFASLC